MSHSQEVRQKIAEDRRLSLLLLLKGEPDYSLNTYLLREALTDFGHGVGAEVLLADVDMLESVALVTRRTVGGISIVTATDKGVDVAAGRVVISGVKRPRPGSGA